MSKYIKWELIDEVRRKKLIFAFIGIIYLLILIVPADSSVYGYLVLPLSFILCGSFFLSFIAGAKRTMESYENKTFLLESMIPLSPYKIMLAKYILAILSNLLYCLIFILGLSTIFFKADINFIKEILEGLFSLKFDEWKVLIRVFFMLLSSCISVTAVTTLMFLFIKSLFPNGKGLKIISFICSGIVMNIFMSTFLNNILDIIRDVEYFDVIYSLILLLFSTALYFASVWFVKNKLEIYN